MNEVNHKRVWPVFAGLAAFALLVVLVSTCSVKERAPRSVIAHCFSALNGSHPDLVKAVRDTLHDPRSFQHVRTVLAGQEGSDRRAVVMTFRANNLLGGTVETRASAMIFPPSCRIEIINIEY